MAALMQLATLDLHGCMEAGLAPAVVRSMHSRLAGGWLHFLCATARPKVTRLGGATPPSPASGVLQLARLACWDSVAALRTSAKLLSRSAPNETLGEGPAHPADPATCTPQARARSRGACRREGRWSPRRSASPVLRRPSYTRFAQR